MTTEQIDGSTTSNHPICDACLTRLVKLPTPFDPKAMFIFCEDCADTTLAYKCIAAEAALEEASRLVDVVRIYSGKDWGEIQRENIGRYDALMDFLVDNNAREMAKTQVLKDAGSNN